MPGRRGHRADLTRSGSGGAGKAANPAAFDPGGRLRRVAAHPPARWQVNTYATRLRALPNPNRMTAAPVRERLNHCSFEKNLGAGEGARTLDPDLGKVVLYH